MVALLVVMVPAAALGTPAAQQPGGNFVVSVAGTAVGSIPHQIDLKANKLPGGQLSEVFRGNSCGSLYNTLKGY